MIDKSTATQIFELHPEWDAAGNSKFHVVDSADGLFDADPLFTTAPLAPAWAIPILVVVSRRKPADIYVCPGGCYLFSPDARAAIEPLAAGAVEWLPVAFQGYGMHFILHPLRQVPLATSSKYRTAEVSGNIVELIACEFEREALGQASVFYASQPPGSAAAGSGFAYSSVFVTAKVGALISSRLSGVKVVPR